jgi:hypothetical protein
MQSRTNWASGSKPAQPRNLHHFLASLVVTQSSAKKFRALCILGSCRGEHKDAVTTYSNGHLTVSYGVW